MYNRGFLNKGYHYEIIQVHIDKSGSFEGDITFPSTFDTVPFVTLVPKEISKAKINISNVTTSSFRLKIENEGLITEFEPPPSLLTFEYIVEAVSSVGQVIVNDVTTVGEQAVLNVNYRVKDTTSRLINPLILQISGGYGYLPNETFTLQGGEFENPFRLFISDVISIINTVSFTIAQGGIGYVVGDEFELQSGTLAPASNNIVSVPITLRVDSIDANGTITNLVLKSLTSSQRYAYSVLPVTYVFNSNSLGGSGAVISFTPLNSSNITELKRLSVLSYGSKYTTLPQSPYIFNSSSVSGTGATVTVSNLLFEIDEVSIIDGGTHYTTEEVITSNSLIELEPVITNESITSVLINNRGEFSVIPTITVDLPPDKFKNSYGTANKKLDSEGYCEVFVPSGEKNFTFGLTNGIFEPSLSPIFYSFRITNEKFNIVEGNNVYVLESINNLLSFGLKIELKDKKVNYYINDDLIYTSTSIPNLNSYSIFFSSTTPNLLVSSLRYKLYNKYFNSENTEIVSNVGNQKLKYIYFAHEKI